MPRSQTLIVERNTAIKQRYKYHKTKNPKWQVDFVIVAVANDFYLSPVTIAKILFSEGERQIPHHTTIYRNIKD